MFMSLSIPHGEISGLARASKSKQNQEKGYKLDLAICPQGIGGTLEENGYRLDLRAFAQWPLLECEFKWGEDDVRFINVTVNALRLKAYGKCHSGPG